MEQVELQAGDLLYLPRGHLHSTTTSESFSAHVMIGITVYSWADLLKEHLQGAIDNLELWAALPPDFASRGGLKLALSQKLLEALKRLGAVTSVERLIDRRSSPRHRWCSHHPGERVMIHIHKIRAHGL